MFYMPSPDEKARRKALKNAVREGERDRIRQSLPLPARQMKELFDFVDEELAESSCDHIMRHTLGFLETHNITPEPVLKWLQRLADTAIVKSL
jgi:Protein of unknown function (DUF2695)